MGFGASVGLWCPGAVAAKSTTIRREGTPRNLCIRPELNMGAPFLRCEDSFRLALARSASRGDDGTLPGLRFRAPPRGSPGGSLGQSPADWRQPRSPTWLDHRAAEAETPRLLSSIRPLAAKSRERLGSPVR